MKQKFSTKWNSSKQVRKQRKYLVNAPLHIQRKVLSANLSKELRNRYGIRSREVRKNDEVRVMRGQHYKKQGKVVTIKLKKDKVAIDGIQKTKKDGTKVNVWFHASKLQIINLNTDDKFRFPKKQIKETTKEIEENVHNKK
jgi:large subunit ribosomal protein L24